MEKIELDYLIRKCDGQTIINFINDEMLTLEDFIGAIKKVSDENYQFAYTYMKYNVMYHFAYYIERMDVVSDKLRPISELVYNLLLKVLSDGWSLPKKHMKMIASRVPINIDTYIKNYDELSEFESSFKKVTDLSSVADSLKLMKAVKNMGKPKKEELPLKESCDHSKGKVTKYTEEEVVENIEKFSFKKILKSETEKEKLFEIILKYLDKNHKTAITSAEYKRNFFSSIAGNWKDLGEIYFKDIRLYETYKKLIKDNNLAGHGPIRFLLTLLLYNNDLGGIVDICFNKYGYRDNNDDINEEALIKYFTDREIPLEIDVLKQKLEKYKNKINFSEIILSDQYLFDIKSFLIYAFNFGWDDAKKIAEHLFLYRY